MTLHGKADHNGVFRMPSATRKRLHSSNQKCSLFQNIALWIRVYHRSRSALVPCGCTADRDQHGTSAGSDADTFSHAPFHKSAHMNEEADLSCEEDQTPFHTNICTMWGIWESHLSADCSLDTSTVAKAGDHHLAAGSWQTLDCYSTEQCTSSGRRSSMCGMTRPWNFV